MDLQYFITFREVARCLSYTRAAERLGYAQPSVTVQIQKLERHYGAELFVRNGKTLALTEAGARLLPLADRIVEASFEAEQALRESGPERLHIGTIESLTAFFLPPYLQAFRQVCPNANLQIFPSAQNDVIANIRDGALDIGLILDPPLSDPELRSIPLRREPLLLVCTPGHPLLRHRELTAADLQSQPLILGEATCTYREALERSIRDEQVEVQVVSELGSIEAIKQCVKIGLGSALLPQLAVASELESGQLASVPFRENELPPFYIQLIWHRNRYLSPTLQKLAAMLCEPRDSRSA
ncbi:LysR family transcriptional regulator [Paenibacillus thermoaerophilus]|uniref:LysR family transcriptional regulator n=1 Tax=Paenibacillus thermoaerophilus TaxID=1215385 RepID=A0ABW2UYP1_9BACL|nr:LysR family transcriptional regulator [Paenibacillus thermoaerophilus]